jgi:hypothetical protein
MGRLAGHEEPILDPKDMETVIADDLAQRLAQESEIRSKSMESTDESRIGASSSDTTLTR